MADQPSTATAASDQHSHTATRAEGHKGQGRPHIAYGNQPAWPATWGEEEEELWVNGAHQRIHSLTATASRAGHGCLVYQEAAR